MLKRKAKPASTWRLVRRVIYVLLLILLLPVVVWWVANRIDEPPSAAALRLSAPAPRAIADADNAWLHLAGIGASAEDDPVAHARRRVDALTARLAKSPTPPQDVAEKKLFEDVVPFVSPDAQIDDTGELCPRTLVDCIEWAGRHQTMLRRLRTANALRLQRYEHLLQLEGWQGLYPPGMETPFPDASVATLHLNLLAADLALALASGDTAAQVQAAQRLADVAEFWRRVPAHASDLYSVMIANAQVGAAHRLAGDLLDRVANPASAGLEAHIDRTLLPLGPIDWRGALSFEYATFVHAISREFPGTWGVLRRCFAGTAEQGCLKTLAGDAAFVPQATFNLHAQNMEAMQRWLEADAPDVEAARATYGAVVESNFVQLEKADVVLRQMGYNFTGRILVSIAVPASDWGLRIHDHEAVRRMLVIKRDAMRAQVQPSAMQEFLDGQPAALRNPYTGEAFAWDGLLREIHFEPKATKHWKRPRLGVDYLAMQAPRRAAACQRDFEFDLFEGSGAGPALHFASCGNGVEPLWLDAVLRPDPRIDMRGRYYRIDARREGDAIGLRLLRELDGQLQRYETTLLLGDGVSHARFQPVGHEGGTEIGVSAWRPEP